jgi:hypothetical protein
MWESNDQTNAQKYGGLTPAQILVSLSLYLVGRLVYSLCFGVTASLNAPFTGIVSVAGQAAGAALVAIALWRLSALEIDVQHKWQMRWILAAAIVQLAVAFMVFVPGLTADTRVLLMVVLGDWLSLAALIVLCLCMRLFCQETGLRRSAMGWLQTTVFVCLAAVAAVVLDIVILSATGTRSPRPPMRPGWLIVAISVAAGPALAFLLNILQMRAEMIRKGAILPRFVVPIGAVNKVAPQAQGDADGS